MVTLVHLLSPPKVSSEPMNLVAVPSTRISLLKSHTPHLYIHCDTPRIAHLNTLFSDTLHSNQASNPLDKVDTFVEPLLMCSGQGRLFGGHLCGPLNASYITYFLCAVANP